MGFLRRPPVMSPAKRQPARSTQFYDTEHFGMESFSKLRGNPPVEGK